MSGVVVKVLHMLYIIKGRTNNFLQVNLQMYFITIDEHNLKRVKCLLRISHTNTCNKWKLYQQPWKL